MFSHPTHGIAELFLYNSDFSGCHFISCILELFNSINYIQIDYEVFTTSVTCGHFITKDYGNDGSDKKLE